MKMNNIGLRKKNTASYGTSNNKIFTYSIVLKAFHDNESIWNNIIFIMTNSYETWAIRT